MRAFEHIKVIAFDADDTLWDCQSHFDEVERQYCQLLAAYGDARHIGSRLFQTECRNVPVTGYGSMAFTHSLIENAINVSDGRVTANELLEVQRLGLSLLDIPATPLPSVEDTLKELSVRGDYRLVVLTKGDIKEQEDKLERSGLSGLFDRVIVVADKTMRQYSELCTQLGISIGELLMVGNSFKSDVEPVLQLGGKAVHIPFHVSWAHEHAEEYDHKNLRCIEQFSELLDIL